MYELKVLTHFAAAHKLKMVSKKCENLHGHNWKVELCIKSDKLDKAGVVMDFGIIKKYLSEIIDRLDHTFLNEIDCLKNIIPSSENIAKYIADEYQKKIENKSVKVYYVTIWESENSSAKYILN